MCGQGKYINNLTEYELNDVARLKEECAKKNQTEEERKEYNKKLYRNNIEKISKQHKEWRENNKDKESPLAARMRPRLGSEAKKAVFTSGECATA